MTSTSKFDPQQLNPEKLKEALEPLSGYSISTDRLQIRDTVLGAGGYGIVRLADLWPTSAFWIPLLSRLVETPTTVAVKQLRTESFRGTELRIGVRLAREMIVWVSCEHENILKFTGYYMDEKVTKAYLVSPYMKNGNIKEYLARNNPPLKRRLEWVFDTIKGLAYLHSRKPSIVHGDLKSLNVLLDDNHKALLCDLGLARVMDDKPTGLTTSNGYRGSVRYSSPEVLKEGSPSLKSDMWAWGCLALEIITGKVPYYEYQNENQVIALLCGPAGGYRSPEPTDALDIALEAIQLLRTCWQFDPEERVEAPQCEIKVESMVSNKRNPSIPVSPS